jgi:predicted nucleic acid-binding protein
VQVPLAGVRIDDQVHRHTGRRVGLPLGPVVIGRQTYSARDKAEGERIRLLLYGFELLPTTDEVWDRALDVQHEALGRGVHRSLSMADLLIAATAERHKVTVLHYDGDYDTIASITGQRTRWVTPAGTADR